MLLAGACEVLNELVFRSPDVMNRMHLQCDDGQIALWIEVDQQHFLSKRSKGVGQMVSECRLAYAAFVVEDRHYFGGHSKVSFDFLDYQLFEFYCSTIFINLSSVFLI
ncbi:protein of unknown function [Nitratireductor aquimarinus]